MRAVEAINHILIRHETDEHCVLSTYIPLRHPVPPPALLKLTAVEFLMSL